MNFSKNYLFGFENKIKIYPPLWIFTSRNYMIIESSRLTNKTVGIKAIFDLISIFNLGHCDMNSLHQGTLMNAYKSEIEN